MMFPMIYTAKSNLIFKQQIAFKFYDDDRDQCIGATDIFTLQNETQSGTPIYDEVEVLMKDFVDKTMYQRPK